MGSKQSLSDRVVLYRLLSRLLAYPFDADVVTFVAGLSLDESSASTGAALKAALIQMQEAVRNSPDLVMLVEQLNWEATRLFEGPGQPAAPPYGSYYVDRRLMGPEAVCVRNAYLASLLLPEQDGFLPPDHLALELGFMGALARDESLQSLKASREFLSGHLLNWLPTWREDVLKVRPHPFFAGLVNFIQFVLEGDLAWLNEVVLDVMPERVEVSER